MTYPQHTTDAGLVFGKCTFRECEVPPPILILGMGATNREVGAHARLTGFISIRVQPSKCTCLYLELPAMWMERDTQAGPPLRLLQSWRDQRLGLRGSCSWDGGGSYLLFKCHNVRDGNIPFKAYFRFHTLRSWLTIRYPKIWTVFCHLLAVKKKMTIT